MPSVSRQMRAKKVWTSLRMSQALNIIHPFGLPAPDDTSCDRTQEWEPSFDGEAGTKMWNLSRQLPFTLLFHLLGRDVPLVYLYFAVHCCQSTVAIVSVYQILCRCTARFGSAWYSATLLILNEIYYFYMVFASSTCLQLKPSKQLRADMLFGMKAFPWSGGN